MIIERDVSQLTVGSYIVDIVKQKGKVKIKTSGWIRDFHQIEALIEQGVQRVSIDTTKHLDSLDVDSVERTPVTDDSEASREQLVKEKTATQSSKSQSKPRNKVNINKQSFAERLTDAKGVFDEAKSIQEGVLRDIQSGREIDIEAASLVVDKSLEIIFQNPDALACVLSIRTKDAYLLEHSVSVSILMAIFCHYMGFDKTLVKSLSLGAFLHDVGKIRIPDKILHKPGKLTQEEFEVIKMHAVYSKEVVDSVDGLPEVSKQIVANHHEKLNGKGYPQGLREDSLTVYDRMISICDIFDALSADRVYKSGFPQLKAFAILRELAQAGDLDVSLVDNFIHCMGVYPVGSLVQLRSNRLAMVEKRNEEVPTKPVVKCFFNLTQNAFTEIRSIDLAQQPNEKIEKAVRANDFDLDIGKISEFLMMQG
ncbi:HD-GYP domain-containing protein [Aliikangiella sp. G2MR2-5]|uniref:HD-GYP domain-containing protein n=1 Tax=Aliikangiella sp. G2MR2-5 TaxID=2788943 RepID=UPI0018AC161F|nr:HD-GYP domain-containing protein [Aliikangiella sp. G2MR2-5]